MRLADTSALYAYYNADDAHHVAASTTLDDGEPTLVTAPILHETIDLIAYRKGRSMAETCLQDMQSHSALFLEEDPGTTRMWRKHSRLSYADAAAVAAARDAHLLTFDEAQAAAHRIESS